MKSVLMIIALLSIGTIARAQNIVYDENAEVRPVGTFSSIDVSGTVSLYLSQGTTQGVAVSAGEEKYNNKIKTEIKNGTLYITVDGGIWNSFNWSNKKLKAYVTVTDLNSLNVSGASFVSISGNIKGEQLKLHVSGASEIKGNIIINNLHVDVSGASVARLSGTAKNASVDASGAANVNSYTLSVDNLKVSTSGASNVKITALSELNADASGGSSIYYKGAAVARNLNSSSGSSIKNRSGNDD